MIKSLFHHLVSRPNLPIPVSGVLGVVIGLVLMAGACAPTQMVTEVAQAAFEDRITEDQVTDSKIKAGIIGRFSDTDKSLILDLSVDVWEGRVLLTGVLNDPKLRNTAVRLARADDRIKEFYNTIQLVSKEDKEERRTWEEKAKQGISTVGDVANDVWIESKIKAQMVTTTGISSVNYRWRSVGGTVYLIGRAGSAGELTSVLDIIRGTKGVKGVEPHVKIKPAS